MGVVTCTIILKSIMSISDISLVFLNYSLGTHTLGYILVYLSLIKGRTAINLRRKMRTAICRYALKLSFSSPWLCIDKAKGSTSSCSCSEVSTGIRNKGIL